MSHSINKWRGTVAIVTGASAGIGAAISEALVKEGLTVKVQNYKQVQNLLISHLHR